MNPYGSYIIRNLRVFAASGLLSPVQNTKSIHFISSTIVHLDPYFKFHIPMHKFEFVPLGELYDRIPDHEIDHTPQYSTGSV